MLTWRPWIPRWPGRVQVQSPSRCVRRLGSTKTPLSLGACRSACRSGIGPAAGLEPDLTKGMKGGFQVVEVTKADSQIGRNALHTFRSSSKSRRHPRKSAVTRLSQGSAARTCCGGREGGVESVAVDAGSCRSRVEEVGLHREKDGLGPRKTGRRRRTRMWERLAGGLCSTRSQSTHMTLSLVSRPHCSWRQRVTAGSVWQCEQSTRPSPSPPPYRGLQRPSRPVAFRTPAYWRISEAYMFRNRASRSELMTESCWTTHVTS